MFVEYVFLVSEMGAPFDSEAAAAAAAAAAELNVQLGYRSAPALLCELAGFPTIASNFTDAADCQEALGGGVE